MEYKDYYKIMGLPRDATQDDIKKAYHRLARKYHPDVSKLADAEERFKELGEAYEVLKDPEKRAAYDRLGAQWRHGQEFRPPPGWDTGFTFRRAGPEAEAFSDFFEALFGGLHPGFGGFGAGLRGKGADLHVGIQIRLEDAYAGAVRSLSLQVPEYDAQGRLHTKMRNLGVHIPAGITEGQQIRLSGQGGPGAGIGSEAGDLYLEVTFAPHPWFRAEGRDIYLDLPLTPWEAALGARIEVPTLGGPVHLTIPPGSQSGKRLRLKGRGLPGRPPGDQYVVLHIQTPPAATAEIQEAYRRLAAAAPYDPRKAWRTRT